MDFEQIYQLYFRDVYLYLRSLSASENVAEEITQETFVKALKAIERFDGSRDIRAWLFTIAKNTYYIFCKREKIYADDVLTDNTIDPKPTFEERFADEESAFVIHQLFAGEKFRLELYLLFQLLL